MGSTRSERTSPTATSGSFPTDWDALSDEIRRCVRCPLHRTRQHVVVYRGPPNPKVLFVGEAPGAEEDRTGVPFVGRAGKRLDEAVKRLGLSDSEYGVLNLIKCRPPKNRFLPSAAASCRPFLERQLAILSPSMVVTLGARALAAFDPAAPPVTRSAGIPRRWGTTRLLPLLHPAASLHAPKYRTRWEQDLETLGREVGSLRPERL